VEIVVTPSAAQTYTDSASVKVADGVTDPNAANDNATLTLDVAAAAGAGPTKCVVPKLGGASAALARKVLPLLGCKAGKTKKTHSKSVAKGLLVGTSPGAGSYTVNKVIALKVSSGPKPKKHKKHKK
jgi:serine/threonine-protein kinase